MILKKSRVPILAILSIGLLPGPLKKLVYRLLGYRLGRRVRIGFGSVVCGDDVTIGDGAEISFFTIVRGRKIRIGPYAKIASLTFLDTPIIEIGDDAKINEQVFVGGLQDPDSRFVLGKRSQVFQLSYINPAKSVVIGDDTAIGGHSLIFGHASWMSELDGYPVTFAPIEIGNEVALSWRVFVLPGTKIGDGTLIAADSLVKETIPPRSLAAGFPARVIGKPPFFPKKVSEARKEALLRRIVDDMLVYLKKGGVECRNEGGIVEVTPPRRMLVRPRPLRLLAKFDGFGEGFARRVPESVDVFLSLHKVPDDVRSYLADRKVMWIDVEARERTEFGNDLGEEVALYLRRYGIRLARVPAENM